MKLSVLLPVYNAERFLQEAIESVLGQTFKDFEFIIINDGSTDNSQAIIDKYQAQDNRIRAYQQQNKGIVATRNKLLELAQTDYIAILDADDVYYPERLQVQYDYMLDNDDLILCGSFYDVIDDGGRFIEQVRHPTSDEDCRKQLIQGSCVFNQVSVMCKKEVVLKIGGYRCAFRVAEDYDLWLRLIEVGKVGNIAQFLVQRRWHSTNTSITHRKEQDINALVARYAYQLRQLSIPDGQDDAIDIDYLQAKLPTDLLPDFKAEYFQALHVDILIPFPEFFTGAKSLAQIEKSLQAFAEIKPLADKSIKARYYLRIAYAYLSNKIYGQCIVYSLRACATDIQESLAFTKKYLQRKNYNYKKFIK